VECTSLLREEGKKITRERKVLDALAVEESALGKEDLAPEG